MEETSVAEMNQEHYRMLQTDPMYALEFAMDIFKEEFYSNIPPVVDRQPEIQEIETRWSRKQWDIVNQLRGEIKFLEKKLNEHIDKSQRKPIIKDKPLDKLQRKEIMICKSPSTLGKGECSTSSGSLTT